MSEAHVSVVPFVQNSEYPRHTEPPSFKTQRDLSINPPRFSGISLVVQWLKLWVSNAQGVGSVLERELRSYMPHS